MTFLDRIFGKQLAGKVPPEPTDHEDILEPPSTDEEPPTTGADR
jgi:hypothetical protein